MRTRAYGTSIQGSGKSHFCKALLLGSAALFAAGAYGEAPAPIVVADAGNIETVVVTGRHRAEKAQDVPLAVSVVSGAELKLQHEDRLADFAAKVPNFSSVQQNTRVSQFAVRGLGGNASNDGVESGVGLIVDNVVFTHVGFSWFDFVDLDHIEVLRGPQGTLLGKNTTVGAVVITTKEPSWTPEADVAVTYGNHDKVQTRANVSAPIIDGLLAFRLTASEDKTNGWITNAYDPHQKLLDTNRWNVRGQLLFTPAATFKDRVIVEHLQSNELNNYYPLVADPNYASGAVRASWSNRLKNLFGYTPVYSYTQSANVNNQGLTNAQVNGISNQFDWTIGDHILTSVSAYRALKFRPYNDGDYTPLPLFRFGYDVDVSQLSQEVRLASPVGQTFEYQVGAYFLHEKVHSNARNQFYSSATKFLTGSALLPSAILDGVEYDQDGRALTDSYAGFAQATWHATEALDLTAGLRYTYEHKAGSDVATVFGGATLPAPYAPYRAAIISGLGGVFSVADKKDTDGVSWLINPSYRVSENVFAYFSVSHGQKSGAVNTGATTGIPVIIKPERATDYEFGLKTNWLNNRLIANINLYWNDISDYQASATNSTALTAVPYLTNAASVRQRGVEFESSFAVTENLAISFNAAHNDATYVSYTNAPAPIEYKDVRSTYDLSGKQLIGAPKWSGQANISFEQPLGNDLVGFTYVNETFRTKAALYNPYSSYSWQGGYGITNAGIGVRTADGQYSLLVWSKNLFDKRYLIGVSGATAYTPVVGVIGDPLTFGVTFDIKLKEG